MKTAIQTHAMLNSLRALAVTALLLTTLSAQGPSPQEKIAALKELLAANQAALKQYSWVETTAISMKDTIAIRKVMMRVESVWNAVVMRSNISRVCSL